VAGLIEQTLLRQRPSPGAFRLSAASVEPMLAATGP